MGECDCCKKYGPGSVWPPRDRVEIDPRSVEAALVDALKPKPPAPSQGEEAMSEGYPPIETKRTVISELARVRRLYEQTRDQRIRQAKEIDALKAEIERLRARVDEEAENYVTMMNLRDDEIRARTKAEARAEAAEARVEKEKASCLELYRQREEAIRERDEARRANSEWLDELDSEQMALRIAEGERDQAIRERDEWKAQWRDVLRQREELVTRELGLERELTAARKHAEELAKALEFYADERMWIREEVKASGYEWASRYDDEKGKCVPVELKPGQSLGFRYRASGRAQADNF